MNTSDARQTLSEIKDLMNRSSKFLTLSGSTSIVIGLYACAAAVAAYALLNNGQEFSWARLLLLLAHTPQSLHQLLWLAGGLLILCIGTALAMSWRVARRSGKKLVLNAAVRRLLWGFALPMIVGGALCLSLFWHGHYGLTSSVMLLFYGLALVSASRYTYSSVQYLGYAQIILGLADSFFEGYGLVFWTLGFGVLHIVYGIFFLATKPQQ